MTSLEVLFDSATLRVEYDANRAATWWYLKTGATGAITLALMNDVDEAAHHIDRTGLEVKFVIAAGAIADIFSTGGDLAVFVNCVQTGNRALLTEYAHKSVEIQYRFNQGKILAQPHLSIALVQGSALGGGFELALAAPFVVAESQAKFGLPEVAFNLFPGMGGFPYLYQKTGNPKLAETFLITGNTYSADELHKMGVVDRVATQGEGVLEVNSLIDMLTPRFESVAATLWTRDLLHGVPLELLMAVTNRWVDDAFKLRPENLAHMSRLVLLQQKKMARLAS